MAFFDNDSINSIKFLSQEGRFLSILTQFTLEIPQRVDFSFKILNLSNEALNLLAFVSYYKVKSLDLSCKLLAPIFLIN